MAKKSGPFTQDELNFLRSNMDTMTVAQMADKLGRNPSTVSSYVSQLDSTGTKTDILQLRKRQDWKTIQQQLSPEELETFEWHWNNIVKQFKEEIYHTEGMQVINAIKHEILANRMLTDQRKLMISIQQLEGEMAKEQRADQPDMVRIGNLERQICSLSSAQEVNNKEYRENSKKLAETLQALKGTREQRIAKVEDAKKNFSIWMKRLMEDPNMRRELGVHGEKMRLATYQELQRLGAPHKYANGEIDRPILCEATLDIEGDVSEF